MKVHKRVQNVNKNNNKNNTNNRIELNFVKHLRIKISESLTQRFDVAMTTLSIDKDKTKNWLNIYGLNRWQNKEEK